MEALLTAASNDYSRGMVTAGTDIVADEAAWVRQAQRSDARAFEALYRLHIDKVYGLCLRMTGNVGEAEDCAQEAFIQAWNKLDKFRGDSAFGTWMHRIAVNAVLGRIRKSKREQDRIRVVAGGTVDTVAIGSIFSSAMLKMIFQDGFYHADPHPANILVVGDRIAFVDFGIAGYLTPRQKEMLGDMFLQILDDARLTDNRGLTVSFRDSITSSSRQQDPTLQPANRLRRRFRTTKPPFACRRPSRN